MPQSRSGLHRYGAARRAAADASRRACPEAPATAGLGTITTAIPPAPGFSLAGNYHRHYLAKKPGGSCGLGGCGGSFDSAVER